MTAKRHHFLSQFYLKGFVCEQSEKIVAIDLKRKKSFVTDPLNVGVVNDFNKIEREGIAPDYLEQELSKIEDKVATAFRNLRKTLDFSGETKELILIFMALIACRTPEMRECLRQFGVQIVESVISMTLSSKEIYESEIHNLKKNISYEGASYEDVKKFVDSKEYAIKIFREHHILMEMFLIEAILPCLFDRRWWLLIADKKSGPFVTTDSPVNLLWEDSEKLPPFYRDNPGFGLKGTLVYFPISQELALIGEFDGNGTKVNATEELVAIFNSVMIYKRPTQIYAPKFDFKFRNKEMNILSGNDLLKYRST